MQKMQILFPDPAMEKLRSLARQEDRPISELVRLAVDRFLEQRTLGRAPRTAFPTFRGGGAKVSAARMKEVLDQDDAL
jgi:hypothetical protein